MPVTVTRNTGRPSAVETALTSWAVQVLEDMESAQVALGFVASGRSMDEYEVVVSKPNEVNLLTASYMRFNITGRGPGKAPPLMPADRGKAGLMSILVPWLDLKNIGNYEDRKSIAYLIGRKQAEQGNAVYRGERSGIPMFTIINDSFDEIMDPAVLAAADFAATAMLEVFYEVPNTKVK